VIAGFQVDETRKSHPRFVVTIETGYALTANLRATVVTLTFIDLPLLCGASFKFRAQLRSCLLDAI
jgi:hypothetical protein